MNGTLRKITILVCLAYFHTGLAAIDIFARSSGEIGPAKVLTDTTRPAVPAADGQFVTIIVNGRALTGPNSSAERRSSILLIPVMALARALGDTVDADAAARKVTVRRQTGVAADLDLTRGQVSENNSAILAVSNIGSIIIPPNTDDLFLSAEIISALFDVAVRYDDRQSAVLITRGHIETDSPQTATTRSFAELYQVDYDYNLNRYSSSSSQGLVLSGTGRIGDGRFSFNSNSTSSSLFKLSPRNVSFSIERPDGQRYTAGDLGTGTNLQFMATNVRGAMAVIPAGRVSFAAFGGRVRSGTTITAPDTSDPAITLPVSNWYRFDTNVFGFFATTDRTTFSPRRNPLTLSAGVMSFSGPARSGEFVTGSAIYGDQRFRLQGDVAFGKFDGLNADNQKVDGTALAFDLSGTIQVTSQLALQGRYAYIGRRFLSPQAGLRDPLDLKAAGVTWSPKKWLSTTINVSTTARPGDASKLDKFVTTAFSITPASSVRFYVSHTQSSAKDKGASAFTVFNASKNFRRALIYVNATRIAGFGVMSFNAQAGATIKINEFNSLDVSQGVGKKGAANGQFEWRTSNLLMQGLSFSAGGGYNLDKTGRMSGYERLTGSVKLPRESSLQVNYVNTNAGPTLLVSVRGTIFRRREAASYADASVSVVNSFSTVSGRVYQDVDLNGRYDPGIDIPQAHVKVRVDGNRYIESDEAGLFRFEAVRPGDRRVYLDLLSVRADLTLLDADARDITLARGRASTVDFRLVRTGRIAGRVWLDANGNGKFDEGETPLAEVRVVTASGRDTLTDADGFFVIGDLAPGEHVVLIDEKTIPEKMRSAAGSRTVRVLPGGESRDVDLAVEMIPAEVKRFGTSP